MIKLKDYVLLVGPSFGDLFGKTIGIIDEIGSIFVKVTILEAENYHESYPRFIYLRNQDIQILNLTNEEKDNLKNVLNKLITFQ